MLLELEKANLMYKLAVAKKNWGAKYDRLEHYKRFPNLDKLIKDLSKIGWIIIRKKSNYTAISLNTEYKREIIEFIETQIPGFKGNIK